MLARAWSVAGLDDGAARSRRRVLFLVATLLSLAVTGVPLASDARGLFAGDPASLVNVVSDLGDVVTLALVAPVLQTTLAMRGGLLGWPWGLLTLSNIAWVFYDALSSSLDLWHVESGAMLIASEAVRVFASGAAFSAGVAQRFAVKEE